MLLLLLQKWSQSSQQTACCLSCLSTHNPNTTTTHITGPEDDCHRDGKFEHQSNSSWWQNPLMPSLSFIHTTGSQSIGCHIVIAISMDAKASLDPILIIHQCSYNFFTTTVTPTTGAQIIFTTITIKPKNITHAVCILFVQLM